MTTAGPPIRLGLIGDNIAASKAPLLHRLAGELCGLSVSYDLLQPADLGRALEDVIRQCQSSGYRGLNITYPYKERVVAYLEVDDLTVRALGAYHNGQAWRCAGQGHALDPIGPITLTFGQAETDAVIDGRFHVNLQTDDDALAGCLEHYRVFPAQRRRVWA